MNEDDIVLRLRTYCFNGTIPRAAIETCLEAVDEIERLRVKIGSLIKAMHKLTEEAYRGE